MPRMDLDSAAIPLGDRPATVDAHVAVWAGAWLPTLVPLEALAPAERARLLATNPDAGVAPRVLALMEAGDAPAAWAVLARQAQPLTAHRGVEPALAMWAAREAERLQLGGPRTGVLAAPEVESAIEPASAALTDVGLVLEPFPWPRWAGPIGLVPAGHPDLAGGEALTRPALPLLGVAPDASREQLASRLTGLTLDLAAPPPAGWPAWLRSGLCAMSAARAKNALLSPRRLHEARRQAGLAGLTALLAARQPDASLSLAVCVPLLHPARRARLASLLDLLRHGAGSEGALRIAYGMTPQTLVENE